MAKEQSLLLKICDKVVKYSLYALIFLMPIFFLPWTSDNLDFNKQTLLILLGFVALFFWMLKVLVSGKFEISASKVHIAAGVMFFVYLMANLFSVNKSGSFWGWPQITAESLLTLIGSLVFYFLVSNVFSKKEISNSIIVLFVSALVAQIIGIFQLFGLYINFNTVGSVGALGIFTAVLLPFSILMLISSKKWWRVFFGAELILSAVILFTINYGIVWWVVFAGSAVLMAFAIIKKHLFDGRWMALPMFFLAISLFFIFLNPVIPFLGQRANEVSLSQNASFNISWQAIKERPIFGSGPGTFSYDFLKFKNPSFSQSSLWSTTFSQATSKILTDMASTGVVGLLALLALIFVPIFYGSKFLIFDKTLAGGIPQKDAAKMNWILVLGILTVLAGQAVAFFLYNSNVSLNFLNFFMMAVLVSLIVHEKNEYELKPSSLLTLGVTFVFTLIFIFGLGLFILDGQRYIAEINYQNGLAQFQAGKIDEGVKSLEFAAGLNSVSDLYFTQLSQAYLISFKNEIKNVSATLSDQEKTKIQTLVSNSVNAAKIATDLNPTSVADWSNRGYIYQNMNGLIADASKWALSSYGTALSFDPNDPYLLSQEGIVNFASKDYATAKDELQKAIGLNANYSNALYYLGLVYDAMGDKANAIKEFTKVEQLNPKDTTIPKILDNLNAGLPALQQSSAPTPVPPSGSVTTPEKKK